LHENAEAKKFFLPNEIWRLPYKNPEVRKSFLDVSDLIWEKYNFELNLEHSIKQLLKPT
jgi:hypothetical protein